MVRTAIFATVILAGHLTAALPPFYQSTKEIQALLADPEFHELLGSAEAIRGIVRTESGYAVTTRTRTVLVDVRYHALGHPGPVPFSFHFNEPIEQPLEGQ